MTLLRKFRALFRKEKLDAEMAEEMRAHLELQAAENERRGMSADEARYAAQRAFGGVEQIKERARDERGFIWLEQVLQDVRYALRQARRHPGFTILVILIVALGIGANTAVFSALDVIMWQPLPVRAPEQLVLVRTTRPQNTAAVAVSNFVSPALYENLRDRAQSLAGLVALNASSGGGRSLVVSARGDNTAIRARTSDVSGNYFSVLGVNPFVGRLLSPDDDHAESPRAVAVLSHNFWVTQFGGDRAVLGQSVLIDKVAFEIVGVAGPGFSGVKVGEPVDVWTPLHMLPVLNPQVSANLNGQNWGWNGLLAMGRLRPDVTVQQAAAELEVIAQQLGAAQRPDEAPEVRARTFGRIDVEPGATGFGSDVRRKAGPLLGILLIVVVLVQVIACANVAGLSLARLASRQRELAARAALGAGRGRLLRQLLTESLVLVGGGVALGLLFVQWGLMAARAQGLDAQASEPILLFVLVIAGLTGAIVAAVPAWQSSRIDLISALKNTGAGSRNRLLQPLVIVQLAVCGCLVAGTGYLVRTVQNLQAVELGFGGEKLVLVNLNLPRGYDPTRRTGLAEELLRSIRALPGVSSATFSTAGLLGGGMAQGTLGTEGYVPKRDEDRTGYFVFAGPNFFETIGLPLIRGRDFEAADVFAGRQGLPKAVINESIARRFFSGIDPIGRRIAWGRAEFEIVGVARDAIYRNLREPNRLVCYVPDSGTSAPNVNFQIRTSEQPRAVAAAIAPLVRRIAPNVVMQPPETIRDAVSRATQEEQTVALGVAAFSTLALLLTALGLYGLLAYNVSQRTREIGVRIALGGRVSDIVALILKHGLTLTLIGWAVGVAAAMALTRVMASRLYGVVAFDPLTLLGSGALLAIVALFACWLPARRAAKVDPMVALRAE